MVKGGGGASDINATVMMATSKHQRERGVWVGLHLEPNKLKTFLILSSVTDLQTELAKSKLDLAKPPI